MELWLSIPVFLIFLIFFSVQFICLWAIRNPTVQQENPSISTPVVSLLLAARNEEKTIERCLEALTSLDYPPDQLEILVGDDASTDQTLMLAERFANDHPNIRVIPITNTLGKARGKANVLAHLAHHARGEYYFITDCDVAVPQTWIRTLLEAFEPSTGLVSGTTACVQGGFYYTLQSLDWLHFMGYIKAFANIGVSCTSVGNNMAVRSEAYWQTGGYEAMDFSITEDYKLFQEVTKHGWGWKNLLNRGSLGLSIPVPSFSELMHQRKRWLIGAEALPWNWKVVMFTYGLFIPALILCFFISPEMAVGVWAAKFIVQTAFIQNLQKQSGLPAYPAWYFPVYEGYVMIMTLLSALFYLLPVSSVWKGRSYSRHTLR